MPSDNFVQQSQARLVEELKTLPEIPSDYNVDVKTSDGVFTPDGMVTLRKPSIYITLPRAENYHMPRPDVLVINNDVIPTTFLPFIYFCPPAFANGTALQNVELKDIEFFITGVNDVEVYKALESLGTFMPDSVFDKAIHSDWFRMHHIAFIVEKVE